MTHENAQTQDQDDQQEFKANNKKMAIGFGVALTVGTAAIGGLLYAGYRLGRNAVGQVVD